MSRAHRAVLLTDLHLRSDYFPGFLEEQIKTLTRLVNRKPPSSVIIAGDIFHRRNPKGDELLAFRTLLEGFKSKNIYVLRGNHDTVAKDGSTETTLSLFSDIAKVVTETETVRIGGVNFDFIPHYEDEEKIVDALLQSKNPVVGHFGFDGCLWHHSAYPYRSKILKSHFTNRMAFLGHIHKPVRHKNVYIMGTQYSNSFGEANARKYVHELIIREGNIEVVKKLVRFGPKHIACTPDQLSKMNRKFRFEKYFTILRLKLDKLDSYYENKLKEDVMTKYKVKHLELCFDDILPKFESDYSPDGEVFALDNTIIDKYIDDSKSVFTRKDLLSALDEIRNHET
jgi:DNA repair exonuclease SbcCD nuclease subunit